MRLFFFLAVLLLGPAPLFAERIACQSFHAPSTAEKLASCLAAASQRGGTADASGLNGEHTVALDIFKDVNGPVDLILCKANYRVTTSLHIHSQAGIRIRGCISSPPILAFSGDGGLIVSNSSRIEIAHLKVRGGGIQIQASNSSNLHFHDLDMSGAAKLSPSILAAIDIEESSDVLIEHNSISGNGMKTAVQGAFDIVSGELTTNRSRKLRVRNNRIVGATTSINVGLYNCEDCEVADNYIDGNNQMHVGACTDCSGYAINVYATAPIPRSVAGLVVSGNRIRNTAGSAIYLVGVNEAVISRNVLEDVALKQKDATLPVGGIAVNGEHGFSGANIRVVDNEISGSGKDCIVTTDVSGMSIVGNYCRQTKQAGIRLRGVTAKSSISSNEVTVAQRGVYLDPIATAVGLHIASNMFNTLSQQGIALNGGVVDLDLLDNSVRDANVQGVLVMQGVRGVVRGNTLRSIRGSGIDWRGDAVMLLSNNVDRATSFGVVVTGRQASVLKTRVSGTSRAISIQGSDAIVEENDLRGNDMPGNLFSDDTSIGRRNRFTNGPREGIAALRNGTVQIETEEYLGAGDEIRISVGGLTVKHLDVGRFSVEATDRSDNREFSWEIIH
jgi:hypothetical protein